MSERESQPFQINASACKLKTAKGSFLSKIWNYRSRVLELSVGITAKDLTDRAFDYLLYPFVIYHMGIIKGGIIMTFLSFIACLLTIKFYDWSKRDWLGIETIKGLKNSDGKKKIGKVTAYILQKSDPLVFLLLSIKEDPFITTAYLRHRKFSGMGRRDWKIFMGSLLVGNAYWTLACFMGLTLVEWGWKHLI